MKKNKAQNKPNHSASSSENDQMQNREANNQGNRKLYTSGSSIDLDVDQGRIQSHTIPNRKIRH